MGGSPWPTNIYFVLGRTILDESKKVVASKISLKKLVLDNLKSSKKLFVN